MKNEKIVSSDIDNIKLKSSCAAIYVKPTQDSDIELEYSTRSDFHVEYEVVGNTLKINTEVDIFRNYIYSDYVLRVYIPEKLIKRLDIVGNAAFVHVIGKDDMIQSCNIDVAVGAFYLENIYADTTVKTITGAIRLKNESIRSNICLETQIGVVDMTLGELSDDVSFYTRGTVKRNAFLRTRDKKSSSERYCVKAESWLGVINIH